MAYTLVDKPTSTWSIVWVSGATPGVSGLGRRIWLLPPPTNDVSSSSRELVALGIYKGISSSSTDSYTLVSKPSSSWSVVDKPT